MNLKEEVAQGYLQHEADLLGADVERLRAENERLRAMLDRIITNRDGQTAFDILLAESAKLRAEVEEYRELRLLAADARVSAELIGIRVRNGIINEQAATNVTPLPQRDMLDEIQRSPGSGQTKPRR